MSGKNETGTSIIGPAQIYEKSTAIMQAAWKADAELRSIMIAPALFDHFTINQIKFHHRSFTAEERTAMKRIDDASMAFVKKFYEDHGRPWCDKCKSYGHSDLESKPPPGVSAWQPLRVATVPVCDAPRDPPPPPISEDEMRAFSAKVTEMREPWVAFFERIETVVFDGAQSQSNDALKRAFPSGKRLVSGRVPKGECLTFSVSNFTGKPANFVAHVGIDLA